MKPTFPSPAALRTLLIAAVATVCAACSASAPPSATQPLAFDRGAALAATNQFRAANGLPPLRIDGRLMAAAERQAAAMAASDTLSHDAGGKLPGRVAAAGYEWATTAENIGRGYASYDAALRGWIGSPGHRRNLLNGKVTDIGFAGARSADGGRNYWVQIFAAPRPAGQQQGVVFSGRVLATGGVLRFP